MSEERQDCKRAAAHHAARLVQPGMTIGLGHGSTTAFAVERIAERLANGDLHSIRAIACSEEVEAHAKRLGIPLTTLEHEPLIDLTIDGADEVDLHMNLIKGGGGALLREKIVAAASHREVIVVDSAKLSRTLGTRFDLPIEVVPFGWACQALYLEHLGAKVRLRGGRTPSHTDHGNLILDCRFGPIGAPYELAQALDARPGIVAHGLFLDMATDLIVGGRSGTTHFTVGDDLSEVIGQ